MPLANVQCKPARILLLGRGSRTTGHAYLCSQLVAVLCWCAISGLDGQFLARHAENIAEIGPRFRDHAVERRLADVDPTVKGWEFPSGTSLRIGSEIESPTKVIVTSTVGYPSLRIASSISDNFGAQFESAAVKLVKNGTDRDNCNTSQYDVAMSADSDMGIGRALALSNAQGFSMAASGKQLEFMHGGLFQLCLAPDGTMAVDSFSYNNVVPPVIEVVGIASDCNFDGCLSQERWDCYFRYKASVQPECILRVGGDGARPGWSITPPTAVASKSRLAWTKAFSPDTLADGQFQAENPQACTASDPEIVRLKPSAAGVGVIGVDFASESAIMPEVAVTTDSAFTVAVCYCPNYVAVGSLRCADKADFIQQIGRLYFWTMRVCDISSHDANCDLPYAHFAPQQPFRLLILCPPGNGCSAQAASNSLKLITASTENSRQSWDPMHGCKSSAPDGVFWSSNFSGGDREDYKDFAPLRLSTSLNSVLDVCYCDGDCTIGSDWIHVGMLEAAQAFSISSTSAPEDGFSTIEYIGKPGAFTFFGGIRTEEQVENPLDAPQFSGSSLINFISFDRRKNYGASTPVTLEEYLDSHLQDTPDFISNMDAECYKEEYQADLISGLSNPSAASDYVAVVEAGTSQYLAFGSEQKTITVQKAGVMAICYCGIVSSSSGSAICSGPGARWLFAGRIMIRGPSGDQVWTVTTGVVFGLTVQGWGLESSDTLRIISSGADCASGGPEGPPGASTQFRVNCPSASADDATADGSACDSPPVFSDIELHASTWSNDGGLPLFITGVTTGSTKTTLTFVDDITGLLSTGDVISIDLARVVVDGRSESQWTQADSFNAQRLSGTFKYLNNMTDEALESRLLGQKVTLVAGTNNQVTIPVGWTADPKFSFTSNMGLWTKHNELSTSQDMKGTTAQSGLVVCWAVNISGERHSAQAGKLHIAEAPQMSSATMSLTTKQRGASAPFILSITTNSSVSYGTIDGPLVLKLVFSDVGDGTGADAGKFVPLKTSDWSPDGGQAAGFSPSSLVLPKDAHQSVCGQFLLEIWSNDDGGFPMPTGCYFGKAYRDGGASKYFREFFLVFSVGNGIRNRCYQNGVLSACQYDIVMNAAAIDASPGDELVQVLTMCPGCSTPYQALEQGRVQLSTALEEAAGAMDSQLKSDGVQLMDIDSAGVAPVSETEFIRFRVYGSPWPDQKVEAGAILRLFMWPLKAWDLNSTCEAECEAFTEAFKEFTCGPTVPCDTESTNPTSGRNNIVRLTMPTGMSPISENVRHTITLTSISLPSQGWFASRFGAQLTYANDTKPFYTTSLGYTQKRPDASAGSARLLISGRTGQGSKPFKLQGGNSIMLRLKLGASLWRANAGSEARLSIVLPSGYSCSNLVATTGAGSLDPTASILTLPADADGYPQYPVTDLSTNVLDGTWSSLSTGRCEYILAVNMLVFAGTAIYARIAVNNPPYARSKMDESNKWEVQLFGQGASSGYGPMESFPFMSLAEEQSLGSGIWAANLAVLNTFATDQQNLQPTNFLQGALQTIQVFFRPSMNTGLNGFVVVDAPVGFDFGSPCQATHLPSEYYSSLGVNGNVEVPISERLRRLESCSSSKWLSTVGFNRARISVTTGLLAHVRYGFALRVTNPSQYSIDLQQSGWLLWTQDSQGYGIEGSIEGIPMWLNPRGDTAVTVQSWGIYDKVLTGVKMMFPNTPVRPTSLSDSAARVMFDGITVPESGSYSLRVTAPDGIIFPRAILGANDALGFAPRINGSSSQDLPATPLVFNGNELRWIAATYDSGALYGFEVMVQVPDHPTTTSSWAFFIEFGYDATSLSQRLQAAVIPAPAIQRLLDCSVDYVGNVQDYEDNLLEFAVRTATPLQRGGGIVVESSQEGFLMQCPPISVAGMQQLPEDAACTVSESPPRVVIQGGSSGIPAGAYHFELRARNPSTTIPTGIWSFGSYNDTMNIPNGVVDKGMQVRGFSIGLPMSAGYLVPVTDVQRLAMGRNDRPDSRNNLAFAFTLNSGSAASDLWLRGPSGFKFDDNCLPGLEMDLGLVLGPHASDVGAGPYTQWPQSAMPTACSGDGPHARITVGSGLFGEQLYIFRIGVQNPMRTPARNIWSIEFRGESSVPFVGFDVWTFTDVQVKPASSSFLATSPYLPVAVLFRPENRVPAETGFLGLKLPSQFIVDSDANGKCVVELAVLLETQNVVYHSEDLNCIRVSATQLLLGIVGLRPLERLQLHSLTVQVRNPSGIQPAENWHLQSFNTTAHSDPASALDDPASALDDVFIPGFATTTAMRQWQVTNQGAIAKGLHLTEVRFEMSPNTAIRLQDTFTLVAPHGLTIRDVGQSCREFQWIGTNIFNATPACPCSSTLHGAWIANVKGCAMSWQSQRNAGRTPAQFSAVVRNPISMPLLVENVWTIQHWRQGALLASSTDTSWQIQPQLRDLYIGLVGPNQVAGQVADVHIEFIAVNHASAVSIHAVSPQGFDFGESTVSSPNTIYANGTDETRAVVITSITAGQKTRILISGVQMAPTGGFTEFDVRTFQDSEYRWSGGSVSFNLESSYKVDEVMSFRGGFRLPGKAKLSSSSLVCKYAKSPTLYPTRAAFEPRVNERGWAEIGIAFEQPVLSGHFLHVISRGSSNYVLYGLDAANVELRTSSAALVNTTATLFGDSGQYSLKMEMHDDLVVGSVYTVRFWAIPEGIGASMWVLETHDGLSTYPSNTNNGDILNFNPVRQFAFQASTFLASPTALVQATLVMTASAPGSGPLTLLTAENFEILNGSCGVDCIVKPLGLFPGTLRQAAQLVSSSGAAPPLDVPLRVNVRLPKLIPIDNVWLIRSHDITDQITAWGAAEGPRLRPMRGVSIFYNALAGKRATPVVVSFEANVAGGLDITLRAPKYYEVDCRTTGALKQLALPGFNPECIDHVFSSDLAMRRELTLVLNGTTLGVGQFAFGILCNLPGDVAAAESVTGSDSTWSLVLRNGGGYIVESIFGIQPLPMTSTPISAPMLSWTLSEADQLTQITMGLSFEAPLSGMQTLLFVFPQRVLHNIADPSDFKVVEGTFPAVAGADGLDLTHMSLLRLFITPGATIPVGLVRFSFPVMLPSEMPAQNLWHLALCKGTECLRADDQGVAISFVLAGFNLGERPPPSSNEGGEGSIGDGSRMHHPLVKTWVFILSLLVVLPF